MLLPDSVYLDLAGSEIRPDPKELKMATGTNLLMKQYRDLVRNIESFSDGQASIKHVGDAVDNDDDLNTIYITFNIKGGPFRGAIIDFKMSLENKFPTCPPEVTCLTELYHPNLDFCDDYEGDDGNVCLNLFDEHWNESCTLEDVVQGLLFLIHNPNLSDPLNSLFCGNEEDDDYERDVRTALRGGCINGVMFKRALPEDYESDFDNEDEDIPKKASDDILTEITREVVVTKQESIQPEFTTLIVDQHDDVVTMPTQAVTSYRLQSVVRNALSTVEKLFTGYFLTRPNAKTIIESSVDPVNFQVCVT